MSLDQNVPRPLARLLVGHRVQTTDQRGWGTLSNGDLLSAAEQAGFQVMITADLNIRYQQNLSARVIALVVLSTNAWPVVVGSAAAILRAVGQAESGSYQEVTLPRPARAPPRSR